MTIEEHFDQWARAFLASGDASALRCFPTGIESTGIVFSEEVILGNMRHKALLWINPKEPKQGYRKGLFFCSSLEEFESPENWQEGSKDWCIALIATNREELERMIRGRLLRYNLRAKI